MMETYSPDAMSRLMSLSARTSWSPMWNTRVIAARRIIVAALGLTLTPAFTFSWSKDSSTRSPCLQAADDFRERPVGEPGFQLARFQRVVGAQHQHRAVLLDRLGRHAQHVVATFDDDFHIGAVADQQNLLGRGVEIGFDIDRACLLFHFGHVRCDAPHRAGENLAGHGVEGDARGLAGLDPGGVDFVHRCAHIEAAVVDQVDRRRGGDAGRRGRGVFADLAGDERHDAGERRVERGALQPRCRHADLRLRTFHVGDQRIAVGLARARVGPRSFPALRADKTLGRASCSVRSASRFALSATMQASRRRSSLVVSWRVARSRWAARSRFHSSSSGCPAFTRSPSFTHSFTIWPPARRRQLGAAAGLDGAGAGVDHGGFHRAARDAWRVRLREAAAG